MIWQMLPIKDKPLLCHRYSLLCRDHALDIFDRHGPWLHGQDDGFAGQLHIDKNLHTPYDQMQGEFAIRFLLKASEAVQSCVLVIELLAVANKLLFAYG